MIKSLASMPLIGAIFASLSAAILLVPHQAFASGTKSSGHGIKCGWVLVSFDRATGASVYRSTCAIGGA